MIVHSVEVRPTRLRLTEPFAVTSGSRDHIETVLVRVDAVAGAGDVGVLSGWGEATPDQGVTGESVAVAARVLGEEVAARLTGVDLADVDSADGVLGDSLLPFPAARAAVDIAVHDLMSRRAGVPLWRFLRDRNPGARPRRSGPSPLLVSRVVSMATPSAMGAVARRHVAAGFTMLKVKVGDPHDWRLDVERVAAVRSAVGPHVGIKVDVNEGWRTVDVAVAALEAIAASAPVHVEQPIDRLDLEGLAEIRRRVPGVAIMADEAVRGVEDVRHLARLDAVDMVNLKVMRIGGLRAAWAAAQAAREAGIGVQVGTMLESSVGSAAGLHLAAALGDVVGVEMGGPLMLAEDVADLRSCYRGETVTLPSTPGLIPI